MSVQVFPSFAGLGFDVNRTELWNNIVEEATSGKETRIALWSYPRHQWDLTYDFLRQGTVHGASYTEFSQFAGFFDLRTGNFDSFLFDDTDNNSVTGQALGTGDGTTAAFQLVSTFGGYTEPVFAPNTISAVKVDGTTIPSAALSAPGTPALSSVTSGALGATTYYVKTTWVTNSGETVGSAESNLVVAANDVLVVTAPGSAPASATGWNVYVSNTAGGGSGAEKKQTTSPLTLGANWQEPDAGLVNHGNLPVANTTGWTSSVWGSAAPGVVTFRGAVKTAKAVTADFTYYFPVRFTDPSMTFTKFVSNLWKNKKVALISLK